VVTVEQVEQVLTQVMDPELGRNIVELGMVRDLKIDAGIVSFTIALTIPNCPLREQISQDAHTAVKQLAGVNRVAIAMGAMTDEERQAVLGKGEEAPPQTPPFNHINRVVAIGSGKGGVGKSSVTALLATALTRANYRVGILDADVTGPSIPRLFGLHDPPRMNVLGIMPAQTHLGISVMSVNLLLPKEDDALIWRGPVVSGVIKQFWNEVVWGDLDYLLVDLPPGTSDVPLTVMQSLPLDGLVLVTTPQDLAAMIVRKAQRMAEQMKMPILGLVENMSGFICPTCGTRHQLFGPTHAGSITNTPLLARLSITSELAELGDTGAIEKFQSTESDALGAAFLQVMPLRASVPIPA
jgi:Mrp family chromosome partitioning ATPase